MLPEARQFVVVTKGADTGAQWGSPQWSPDGQRLLLVEKRGLRETLWIWERAANKLRQVSKRALSTDYSEKFYQWLDSAHVLCSALLEGQEPEPEQFSEKLAQELAKAGWEKQAKGLEPSVSVLDAGIVKAVQAKLPEKLSELLLLDVRDGASGVVLGAHRRAKGFGTRVLLSPDKKAIAVGLQLGPGEPSSERWDKWAGTQSLTIQLLTGQAQKLERPLPENVVVETYRWSPDGKKLAFLAYRAGGTVPELWRVNVQNGTATSQDIGDLDITPGVQDDDSAVQVEWVGSEDIVVLASKGKRTTTNFRRDWWLVKLGGEIRNLSKAFTGFPLGNSAWSAADGGHALFGVAGGRLWRLDAESGTLKSVLDACQGGQVARIAWMSPDASQVVIADKSIVSTLGAYCAVDVRSSEITPFEKPTPDSRMVAVSPKAGVAFYAAQNKTGSYVWRSDIRSKRHDQVMSLNSHVASLAEGKIIDIDYRSLNGRALVGKLLLPIGYRKGVRYPLVTKVYPTSAARALCSIADECASFSDQIFAAAGYAVLSPSMPPFKSEFTDGKRDTMLDLPNGVLPAVDKIVELGIADSDRVFLMGHSGGGFATYGLIVQTDRFKAAVPMAGFNNYISQFGTFMPQTRYTSSVDQGSGFVEGEDRHGLHTTPWQDLGLYLRNSPIFYADRVKTPVMIIQGDMDYVVMQQGEEFFSALQRLGKRVQFVRYWGEGHVLESRANIRDMWTRILAWFDEFGDIARDAHGNIIVENDHIKSRGDAPKYTPEDFLKFDFFLPANGLNSLPSANARPRY
jgi:dipeptidyl aminopeptidase/acylaminoacyl peptidase